MKNFSIKKLFNLIIFALCLTLIITSFAFAQSGDPSDLIDEYPSPIFTDLTINDSLNANEALFKGKIIFENVIEVFASALFKEGVIFEKEIDAKTHIFNTSVDEAGNGNPLFVKDDLLVEGEIKGLNKITAKSSEFLNSSSYNSQTNIINVEEHIYNSSEDEAGNNNPLVVNDDLLVLGKITADSINMSEMFTVVSTEKKVVNPEDADTTTLECEGEMISCSFEPCFSPYNFNQEEISFESIETNKATLVKYMEENFGLNLNIDYGLADPREIKESLATSTQQTFINILNHSDIYGEPLRDDDSVILQINDTTIGFAPYKDNSLIDDGGSFTITAFGNDGTDITRNYHKFDLINEKLDDEDGDKVEMNIYIYDASEEAWFEARPSSNPVFENNGFNTINSLELIVLNPRLEDLGDNILLIKNYDLTQQTDQFHKLLEFFINLNDEIIKNDNCITLDEGSYYDYLSARINNIVNIETEIVKFFEIGKLLLHLLELEELSASKPDARWMQNYHSPYATLKNTERGKICVGGVYNSSSFVNIAYYLNASCFDPSANIIQADTEYARATEINTAEVTEFQKIMYKMISP